MRVPKTFIFRLLPLLLVAAAPDLPPEELYAKGGYRAAAEAGARIGDAPYYAVAARATIADATLRETPCLDCLHRAQELARLGIEADPAVAENYVQLAIAMGFEARIIGPIRARLASLPRESKEAIDRALKLTPYDPWALSAAGGWNIEVARIAGSLIADALYDASFAKGAALYRQAMAADPGNLVIPLHYALSVTSYDFERNRLEIMAVLESVARGVPLDAYAQAMQERAAILHDLLLRDKREEYRALAHRYLGFP